MCVRSSVNVVPTLCLYSLVQVHIPAHMTVCVCCVSNVFA